VDFANNADNDILATGCRDYCIIIWQVVDWKKLKKIEMHQSMYGLILSLGFLLNDMLASGAKDEDKIRIWSVVTGKLLQTLSGHSNHGHGHIVSLIVLPNKTLTSAGSDTIKIWNIENLKLIKTFEEHSHLTSYIKHMSLLPSGNLVSCSLQDEPIKIWNINYETNQYPSTHIFSNAIFFGFNFF